MYIYLFSSHNNGSHNITTDRLSGLKWIKLIIRSNFLPPSHCLFVCVCTTIKI